MTGPNLFAFAPSELAQDAALSWLLSWADPEHAVTEPVLHGSARRLLAAMFAKENLAPPPAKAPVSVRKQHERIDVLVEIGDTHVLAIEDKVHTEDHSDQLRRYARVLAKEFKGRECAKIYLKTGDQCDYDEVERQGWKVFDRGDLLAALRPARPETTNAILCDFFDHLEAIDRAVRAYATLDVATWDQPAWRGFFTELQAQLGDGGWRYVHNATGGFMGFWWGWIDVPHADLYLQLEDAKLVVKLAVEKEENRRPVRDHWVRVALERLSAHGFVRPGRLGHGRHMTVAVFGRDYRATTDDRIDLGETVATLREATRLLQDLGKESR